MKNIKKIIRYIIIILFLFALTKNLYSASIENELDIKKNIFLTSAKNGDLNQIKQMLKQNIDVNCTNQKQQTALMLASLNGHDQIVNEFLNYNLINTTNCINVNAVDYAGRTALIFAAAQGHLTIVKLFLEYKKDDKSQCVNVYAIDNIMQRSAFMFALMNGHDAIAKELSLFYPSGFIL